MMRFVLSALVLACIAVPATASGTTTLITVGPEAQHTTISNAVEKAESDRDLNTSYVIEVLPGTYTNDFLHITRPMTIRVDLRYAG